MRKKGKRLCALVDARRLLAEEKPKTIYIPNASGVKSRALGRSGPVGTLFEGEVP